MLRGGKGVRNDSFISAQQRISVVSRRFRASRASDPGCAGDLPGGNAGTRARAFAEARARWDALKALHAQGEMRVALLVYPRVEDLVLKVERGLRLKEHT